MNKTPAELLAERTKRIDDAIALRVPDRVPTLFHQGLFPARYAGITYQDAFYELDKWLAAHEKALTDFAPDVYYPVSVPSGSAFDVLGYMQMKWPGHGIG